MAQDGLLSSRDADHRVTESAASAYRSLRRVVHGAMAAQHIGKVRPPARERAIDDGLAVVVPRRSAAEFTERLMAEKARRPIEPLNGRLALRWPTDSPLALGRFR